MPLTQKKLRIGPASYNLDSQDGVRAIIKEMAKRIVALEARPEEAKQSRLDYMSHLISEQSRQIKSLQEKLQCLEDLAPKERAIDASEKQLAEQRNSD